MLVATETATATPTVQQLAVKEVVQENVMATVRVADRVTDREADREADRHWTISMRTNHDVRSTATDQHARSAASAGQSIHQLRILYMGESNTDSGPSRRRITASVQKVLFDHVPSVFFELKFFEEFFFHS